MTSYLKGNYKTVKSVAAQPEDGSKQNLEERFEREALKRLGGSISFVSKKKVKWDVAD
jgi:hypothetical protein